MRKGLFLFDIHGQAIISCTERLSSSKRINSESRVGRAWHPAQCARMGDLHHALAAGAIHPDGVHAELAEIVAGKRPGRTSPSEITLFDSTGIALEDADAAALVYERAEQAGAGTAFRS